MIIIIIFSLLLYFQRSYLSSLGGKSVGKKVNNILRKVGTPRLWQHYSLKGQRMGKTALVSLRLHEIILGKW